MSRTSLAVRDLPLGQLGRDFVGDRALLSGVIAALVANLAMYAYVWSVLAGLPELIPLHYNGAGVVDLIGRPVELFKLPTIGAGVLVVNALLAALLLRRERVASHMLVWTSLIVQLVFGSGVWVLVEKAAGE